MWFVYALGSAVFAALTSILAKIGIEGVNSTLATAIRTAVVLLMSWGMVFLTGTQTGIAEISRRSWLFLVLSGLATGASWLCYYHALQIGAPGISHCWYFDNKVTDTEGKIENITLLLDNTFLNNCAALGSELSEYADRFKKNTSAVKFTKEKSGAIIGILKKMCGENAAERIASIIKLIILIGESGGMKVVGKSQKTDKEKERMQQIQTYVVCNAKRNITLDDVARHIGMNRTSFCIFFKRTTGQTFVTYLNEHRIRLACQLLRQKKMSVSEICYAVGFNDVPYFNRVFKRCNGVTPRKYK